MADLKLNREGISRLFVGKLKIKDVAWRGIPDIFPADLPVLLAGYWARELGRLVCPVPEMDVVLEELKRTLRWLTSAEHG